MKISAKSNMYTFNAEAVLQKYENCIEASPNVGMLVFASAPLPDNVRDAVEKAAAALKVGEIGWVHMLSSDVLTSGDIWLAIEGLDPVCVVCCDAVVGRAVAGAYKTKAAHDSVERIMCRSVCFFDDLASLLEKDKQLAWSILKRLV